ncbi:Spy/CpxP family protein refolding chaperone [Melioribacteraceae bacterium 4301-Me]|uniref:Spy/CpxP family protein refolding chaperone n=1 Tax=Pyranulibacter aquaticus TaxID=3163344 RepID=UPI0035969445
MKKNMLLIAVATLISFGLISAQPNKPKRPMFQNMGRIFSQLNLTADQQKQINDIMYNQRQKAIDLQSSIEKNRLELQRMIRNNNIDDAKILSLVDDNSKLQAQLKSERVKSWLAVYKILTPEQRETWTKAFGKLGSEIGFMRNKAHMLRKFGIGQKWW